MNKNDDIDKSSPRKLFKGINSHIDKLGGRDIEGS